MNKTTKDTYGYKGWLTSDSFMKRSFASVGYQSMGALFVYLIIMAIALVAGGVGWLVRSVF